MARQLTPAQFARLAAYGVQQDVSTAEIVFTVGDADYDLIAVESGSIELLSPATHDEAETRVALFGPGGFVGELNLLTGQAAYLTARVVEPGRIHRISPAQFRRVMADDPEVSDLLLQSFLARRDLLRSPPAPAASKSSAAATPRQVWLFGRTLPANDCLTYGSTSTAQPGGSPPNQCR